MSLFNIVLNTNRNQKCVYCPPMGEAYLCKPSQLDINLLEPLLEECKNKSIKKVRITGGEPLLYRDLNQALNIISKYSEERGWKLQLEFNQNSVIFRRSPRELKEKFGDRRVIDLKSHYGNPDDKVRISFNWLKDRDKKPYGKFDFKYGETRWYFEIERDGKLDLSSHSDFEKVLVRAYNATTER